MSPYQRTPLGHPVLPQLPAAALPHNELLANWAPFLQFLALAEQRFRHVAREEAALVFDEKHAAFAVAEGNEKYITAKQAAELLGVLPQTVYEWIKAGKLKSNRTGVGNRTLRLKQGDVYAALHEQIQPDGRRKYARRSRINATTSKAKGGVISC